MRSGFSRGLVALVLVLACGGGVGGAASDDPPRRIVVKLRAATAAQLGAPLAAVDTGRSGAPAALKSFLQRYRARTIRPAMPGRVAAIRESRMGEAQFTGAVRARFGARARRAHDPRTPDLSSIYVLNLEPGVDAAEALAAIAADGIAEYAEEDKPVHVSLTTNDPYLVSTGSWGQSYGDLWGLTTIGAPAAWDVSTGGGVVVAVVDTGLDVAHPDIAANVWVNAGEIPGNGIDDDGNGYVDDVNGWDFIGSTYTAPTSDSVPDDQNGHGTHVAGTVAATGGNGQGVIGVAWNARVMPVKGLDRSGTGWSSLLASAMVYAADNGADVINNSWGGPGSSPFVRDAVAYAHGLGAVVVAAAGNDNEDAAGYYPPRYPQVVVVGSTDSSDYKSSFSNWGSRVDVSAPGRDILSLRASGTTLGTPLNSQYTRADGTSMAAPHVSGLAALILAAHPEYTNEQVRQVLRASATDRGSAGYDLDYGYGRVNAAAAVAYAAPLEAKILEPVDSLRVTGATDVRGRAHGAGFVRFTLERGAGTTPTSWTQLADSTAPVAAGSLGSFDPANLPDGAYTLRLQVYDDSGRVFTDRVQVVVDFVSITSPAPPKTTSVAEVRKAGAPVAIVGSATGPGFQSFQVDWARGVNPATGWTASGMEVTGGGAAPILSGTLATWDTADVSQADYYTIRVRVQNEGFTSEARTIVYLEPDLLNASWPKSLDCGSDDQAGVVPAVDANGSTWLSVGCPAWLAAPERKFQAFRADGEAEFASSMDYATSFLQHAAGDVDGIPGDEFVVNDAQTLRIYRTDGSYTTLSTEVWRNFQYSPTLLKDLDGDGRPEILAAGRNRDWNEVAVYAWHDNGQIVPGFPISLPELNRNVPYSVPSMLVADFDGDGRPDILTIESTSSTSYTLRLFSAEGLPLSRTLPTLTGYPREMMLADFERDGSPEIVLTGVEGSASVTHVFSATGQERPGWPLAARTAVAIADFDGDKQPEIVVKGEGGISIRRADGSLFSAAWPHVEESNPVYGRPSVADVTGDGVPEILVTRLMRQDSPSPLVTGADAGQAAAATTPPAPPIERRGIDAEGQATLAVEPAAEVVTWRSSYYLQLVALDRDNSEVRRWTLLGMRGADVEWFTHSVTAGDFDGDGNLDLAVTYRTTENSNTAGVLTVLKTGAPVTPSEWPMLNHDPQNTGSLIVPDTGAPSVSLLAPAPGAAVSGVYTVVAAASDDGWVAGVQFLLDGQPMGPEVTWPPFQAPWDTAASTPGPHRLSAVARDGAGHTAVAAPVDVVVEQASAPTIVITSPVEGQEVTGTVNVTVTAADDHAVRSVELYVDGVKRAASAVAPFPLRWLSWQDASGSHALVAKAYDDYGNVTASPPVNVVLKNEAGWDATIRAPYCPVVGSVCDTGTLVDGRGTLGPEAHAPNTIGGTCPDTTGGTYHDTSGGDAVDRVRVFTSDGAGFAPGRTVTVETTVWASVFYASRTLQVFHAADARAPQWQLVAQLKAPGKGKRVLSTSFQLPVGDRQAFRTQYSPATGAPACLTSYGYTDHDDVVFQVGTNAAPVAAPGGPYSGYRQRPLAFDGTASSDPDGDTLSYAWDFGDGTAGTGATPTHVYASTGTFTVALTVSDGVAVSTAATTTATVDVPPNSDPVANAGGPYAGARQQALTFNGTGSSDPDGDSLTYTWDFGDGSAAGTGPTPTHAYATLGMFTVILTVDDGNGGSGTAATTVSITNRAPLAAAGPDQTVELGANVTLLGSGSDPDGDPVSLEWRDGAGTVIGTTPSITLTLPLGAHDFTLVVGDGVGGSATDSVRVTVQDTTPPVVSVTKPSGVQLLTGVATLVEWTVQDNGALASFDVQYSTNGGASFSDVPGCASLPASARSCTWSSPGPATAQGRVRVAARDASSNTGLGESAVTIVDPTMTVTSPNTAVAWGLGSRRTITWTTNLDPAGTVRIELSRDGGSTWSVLAAAAPNGGAFNWVVAGAATTAARVRVTSNSVSAATDTSNVNFPIAAAAITVTSPNTSVRWAPGTSQTIQWNHNLGVQESVKIEISRDGGSTWSVIAASVPNSSDTTGSRAWIVTTPTTTKARIRVGWTTNSGINDRSDVNFTIR